MENKQQIENDNSISKLVSEKEGLAMQTKKSKWILDYIEYNQVYHVTH